MRGVRRRLKGKADEIVKTDISRCEGGGIQFVTGREPAFQPGELVVCGQNERFAPPIVMFQVRC